MLRTLNASSASRSTRRPVSPQQFPQRLLNCRAYSDAWKAGGTPHERAPGLRSKESAGSVLPMLDSRPNFRQPLPAGVSQPRFVDVDAVRRKYAPATWNRISLADPLLMSFQGRGIGSFLRQVGAGNLNTAVDTVVNASKLMLCTGFNVDRNLPETDGPVGVALLAYACCRAGKQVVVVADALNAHLVREALLIRDPACLKQIQIETVEVQMPAGLGALRAMLDKHAVDVVIQTEVPGRTREGKYLNMRGIPIGDFNAPLDELLNLANERLLGTIGVGDGGNEAGMGGLTGVPPALNGLEMQAVIPASHQVIAWNSNLGAIALGEFVLASADKGTSCKPETFRAIVRKLFKEGAVDGVTRLAIMDERIENPAYPRHYNHTCVDGASSAIHIGNLLQLQDIAHNVPLIWPTSAHKNS
jgi:hypothetical protein